MGQIHLRMLYKSGAEVFKVKTETTYHNRYKNQVLKLLPQALPAWFHGVLQARTLPPCRWKHVAVIELVTLWSLTCFFTCRTWVLFLHSTILSHKWLTFQTGRENFGLMYLRWLSKPSVLRNINCMLCAALSLAKQAVAYTFRGAETSRSVTWK